MAQNDPTNATRPDRPADGIVVEVPAVVAMRSVVMGATAAGCRVLCPPEWELDRVQRLTFDVVAAVAEAFVHVVSKGHRTTKGRVRLEMSASQRSLVVRLLDDGESHDPVVLASPMDVDEPDTGAMLLTTFVDKITYRPGSPNVLTMVKSLRRTGHV